MKDNSNTGSTLIIVIFAFVVLSFLSLILLSLNMVNMKMNTAHRDYQSAYYIAEAGILHQLQHLHGEIMNIYTGANDADSFFQELDKYMPDGKYAPEALAFTDYFGGIPYVNTYVERLRNKDTMVYTIISRGNIGYIHRSAAIQLKITWVYLDSYFNDELVPDVQDEITAKLVMDALFNYSAIREY